MTQFCFLFFVLYIYIYIICFENFKKDLNRRDINVRLAHDVFSINKSKCLKIENKK